MRSLHLFGAALAACVAAGPATAASSIQPPMNTFNSAFYTCDEDGAFMISYDSDKPQNASVTTSGSQKPYKLKRDTVTDGVQFSDGTVKFWTDGKTALVDGTQVPFRNCKMKAG